MKKGFLVMFSIVALALSPVAAQNAQTPYTGPKAADADEPIVVFRDRLVLDVFHSFWMNMPKEVDHMKFDPGFNVSLPPRATTLARCSFPKASLSLSPPSRN